VGRRRGGHGLEKIGVHNAVRVLLISGREGFERSISDISVLSFSGNRARVPGCVYTITFLASLEPSASSSAPRVLSIFLWRT